ncbi:hypothetical protein PAQU9191_00227 [Photobacterium aquimaris]|uniref:DUF4442 domain-containing protein n=1 Tax=Photobacterium aquimaris TaxID=512643 RepID=A0A1Y6KSE9_9GAMM|nr:hypothetical protein PAQU9191_00227 [Photobacterium aquimaris]
MFDYYKPSLVKLALNLWPPFWGAGIKILFISDDFRYIRLQLKLRWWNKNANRTQYGGSIFSLTDPVYSLMLMGIYLLSLLFHNPVLPRLLRQQLTDVNIYRSFVSV